MKITSLVLALAWSMGFGTMAYAAPQAGQPEHETHAAALAPVPAQRWTPDAPLQEGMRRARAAVDALREYEAGRMSASVAVDQAKAVEAAVVYMFSNCKLAPEPDAALHGILVPLLSAAQALKADPGKVGTIADMRAAIARYPHYFNDPGWNRLSPDAHGAGDSP
jgi:hypothetical protein